MAVGARPTARKPTRLVGVPTLAATGRTTDACSGLPSCDVTPHASTKAVKRPALKLTTGRQPPRTRREGSGPERSRPRSRALWSASQAGDWTESARRLECESVIESPEMLPLAWDNSERKGSPRRVQPPGDRDHTSSKGAVAPSCRVMCGAPQPDVGMQRFVT